MKIAKFFLFIFISLFSSSYADVNLEFEKWKNNFKIIALSNNISEKTFNIAIKNTKYLPNVIKYDRYQPEFYEDTKTYISKRTSTKKLEKGLNFFSRNKELINTIEIKFDIEKELLLALMGIETNFGKYLGKMDIISSLATLSFDKRRSAFFKNELLTLLSLLDRQIITKEELYGSWAGAFGNFQFMPSTIKNYALDYNKNANIELKEIEDSFASAANYINKIGWKKNQPCFYKVELKGNIPLKYLNTSAKKIKNKKKLKFFKKYLKNNQNMLLNENVITAIVTPDKDIIPGSNTLKPAYLVFSNYEKVLKWNRSLRFAIAVCTLKNMFKNEI